MCLALALGFPQGVLILKEIGHESTDSILDQLAYKARITAVIQRLAPITHRRRQER
jgi:hypothetical protein